MTDAKFLRTLIVGVLAAWGSTLLIVYLAIPEWQERGQFGDLFGSVNSLFSGLAFVGLFFTVRLQQRQLGMQSDQLELQRQELRLQREEMAAARGELAKQAQMQRALFKATVAQVRVASVNAMIEAKKIQAESVTPLGRQDYWTYIEGAAKVLSELAEKVEREAEA